MSEHDSIQSIINIQRSVLDQLQLSINAILTLAGNKDAMQQIKNKQETIRRVIGKLEMLNEERNKQKRLCKDLEIQSTVLHKLTERIETVHTHLSENGLLDRNNQSVVSEVNCSNEESQNAASLSTGSYEYTPMPEPTNNTNRTIKPVKLEMLDIDPLTTEEYLALPKYMVGRITLDTINKFVEVVNQTVSNKYQLLYKSKWSLKTKNLQLFKDYKLQETADTKGKNFITEADICKQQGKKILDKISYNLLTILRHKKRLYENRSGGTLKYIMILS